MAYKIMHTGVGPFPQGRVVSVEQLEKIQGMDVDRLLNVGAIAPAEAGEPVTPGKLPPGPENPADPANSGKKVKAKGAASKNDSDNAPEPEEDPADGEPVEEDPAEDVEDADDDETETEEAPDYSSQTKAQLLEMAKGREIEGADGMKKDELVAALEAKDVEDAA